jgi:predicted ATPase/DNA-binding CsgD family transcriptional regulator
MVTPAQTNGSLPINLENPAYYSKNLLSQDNLFIGRARELATIEQCFQDPSCRLLTLTGLGGIGKTRLASEAGAQFAHHFAESSYFILFAPIASPDLIIPTLAASLGYLFQGTETPLDQLINFLRKRNLLLVLDNFEHLLSSADLIAALLQGAPNLRLLITSRERLNLQQEWVLDIQGLDYPLEATGDSVEGYSAIQFFLQCARRAKADFQLTDVNQADMIRICRLVEGVPLGIELAASWARALSCREIGDEIERNLDFLTTSLHDVPDKHRSMRAVFAHTYSLLTADQRLSFSRLSVFRGGFRREAAEAVASASLDMLAILLDKSLLRVDADGRYDMHELLRQYGEELLKLSGLTDAARTAHSAHYAAFLHQRWVSLRTDLQIITLNEIEIEFENVRTAWQTMVEKRNTTELSMAVYSMWLFSDLRSQFHIALMLFQQAEEAFRPVGDEPAQRLLGQLLTRRGWFYVTKSNVEEGRKLNEEGLALLERVGSSEDLALAYYSRCCIDAFQGDALTLRHDAEQMLQIARRSNDAWLEAASLFSLSNAALIKDDFEQAGRLGHECLSRARSCGDFWLQAMSLSVLAGVAEALGDYAQAKRKSERSLRLLEALGQKEIIGATHGWLGMLALRMGNPQLAASHFEQSLTILASVHHVTNHVMDALLSIAKFWLARGEKVSVVEMLTVVLHHPESLDRYRERASHLLRQLQTELSPTAFAAAQERGIELELDSLVQGLIVGLSQLRQVPVQAAPLPKDVPLTKRELEIVLLVSDGFSNRDIAARLFLSPGTVKWYLSEIYSKLGVHGRMQAVARVHDLNLLS